jgi:hypothetical protein
MDDSHRFRRARRLLALFLGAVVIAFLPWTAYLSATLPGEHVTHHWDLAWAGFDLFEAGLLAATLVAFLRSASALPVLAAGAGTALLCDAWFDLITSDSGRELHWALGEAFAAEIPLAILCFWMSHEAGRWRRISGGAASGAGPPPTAPPDLHAEGRASAGRPGTGAPSEGRTSR